MRISSRVIISDGYPTNTQDLWLDTKTNPPVLKAFLPGGWTPICCGGNSGSGSSSQHIILDLGNRTEIDEQGNFTLPAQVALSNALASSNDPYAWKNVIIKYDTPQGAYEVSLTGVVDFTALGESTIIYSTADGFSIPLSYSNEMYNLLGTIDQKIVDDYNGHLILNQDVGAYIGKQTGDFHIFPNVLSSIGSHVDSVYLAHKDETTGELYHLAVTLDEDNIVTSVFVTEDTIAEEEEKAVWITDEQAQLLIGMDLPELYPHKG